MGCLSFVAQRIMGSNVSLIAYPCMILSHCGGTMNVTFDKSSSIRSKILKFLFCMTLKTLIQPACFVGAISWLAFVVAISWSMKMAKTKATQDAARARYAG